ncbi:tyrosine-type recombinase/integrase [Salidesulfovibrio brasiliensis]|uniref:tyrosine-type recombinase/integrase n=1 Tax=Salidesulfovibrio brasiliensis TaxID=221711 RepID=UPI000AB1D169|nr:integrase [Salidesulfovibrio brasiliensis]
MTRSVFMSRKETESTTLDEALERFKEEFLSKYAQPKSMKSRVKVLREHDICKMALASIRGKDVASYIKDREDQGRCSQTILHEVNQISRVFEISRKDWGMESLTNPTKGVNKPKQNKGRTRRLDKGEENKLLEKLPDELKPIVLFALETAMRRGEIAMLRWEHVDLKKRYVHLPKTKNDEARSVPLSPTALEILKSIPLQIKGGCIPSPPRHHLKVV